MNPSAENALAAELPRLIAWRNGLISHMANEIHARNTMMPSVENALAAELPRLLAWREGLVGHMARQIHAECDWQALPLLADALEDAGCTVPEVLEHLRNGAWHHGFCFVVDTLRHQAEKAGVCEAAPSPTSLGV